MDANRPDPPRSRSLFGRLRGSRSSSSSSKPPSSQETHPEDSSATATTDRSAAPPDSPPQQPFSAENSPQPSLATLCLSGYSDSAHHRLMDDELAANIRLLMPPRLQLYDDWEMVYSLEQHGTSLNSLYRSISPEYQHEQLRQSHGGAQKGFAEGVVSNMVAFGQDRRAPRPHGYVMVVQDEKKNRFGCFLNEPLRPVDHKRYYGNGECFLWKCEWYDKTKLGQTASHSPHGMQRFKAFVYTGINDNIIYSNHNYIAIGSSSGYNGLWIDKSLNSGVSYPCDTFGNEILNEHGQTGHKFGKFKIMALEMWRVGSLS